jgi:predicted transcriptional regulator
MTQTITVRLPRALVEEVRQIARAHDRSLAAQVRVALDEYVREHGDGARRLIAEREQRRADPP